MIKESPPPPLARQQRNYLSSYDILFLTPAPQFQGTQAATPATAPPNQTSSNAIPLKIKKLSLHFKQSRSA
jgi:hypothetical protein